jgi:transcriptional regulator with PAS, ATPase and Fis domain
LQALSEHDWNGNVRELKKQIEHAAREGGDVLFSWNFKLSEPLAAADRPGDEPAPRDRGIRQSPREPKAMKEVEREAIMEALQATRGNKVQAAKSLEIALQTLYSRMDRHDIPRDFGAPRPLPK